MVHRRSSSNNNLETNYIVDANNHENVTERKTSTSKVESSNAKPNNSNEESTGKLEDESNVKKGEKSHNKKTPQKINNVKEAATKTSTNKTRLNTVHESSSTKNKNGPANDEFEGEKLVSLSKRNSNDDEDHQVIVPKTEEQDEKDDASVSLIEESKGIICSLPLERLSGILGTLTQSKESSNSKNNCLDVQNHNKILCLYCDRTFSSQKLHIKHTERAHKLCEGRRSSIRNTSNSSLNNNNNNNNNGVSNSPTTTSSTSSSSSGPFSGCSFCTSNKLSPMVADDLDTLFNHIVDTHNDKYFACRECTTRFINEDNLNNHLKNVHNQEIPQKRPPLPVTKPLSVIVDFEDEIIARMQVSKRDMDDVRLTRNAVKSMQDSHISAKEQMLMRLGIAQHRSPRTRKGAKNRRGAPTDGSRSEVYRPSRSRCGRASVTNLNSTESNEFVIQRTKNEVLNCTFDEDFYETVSNNVRLNLSCHLDGKLDSNPTAPSPLSPVAVCPTVRSTVVHNPLITDGEIHEATSLSTTTAFPTLLTADQYGKSISTSNKYKKPMTKNSWKWKWDLVKKYKYVNEGGKIVKKVKQPTSGLRDLSKLDMWTQLVMRKKHEDLVASEELDSSSKEDANSKVRQEKRRIVEQLNCILDKRLLPQINIEQDEQRVIKPDPDEDEPKNEQPSSSSPNKKYDEKHISDILKLLPAQQVAKSKLTLSGEWARPRCYICFCCGAKFETIKHLEEHKSGRHPHINCTHYEVVGRELIEKQFYNNFYLPTKALEQNNLVKHGPVTVTENEIVARLKEKETTISVEDSMDSVTSTSVSIVTSHTTETDSNTKSSSKTSVTASSSVQQSPMKSSCSKCNKETNSLLDLHRHILDCSGDYAWAQVKKRLKYRRLLGKKRRVSRGLNIVRRPKSLSKTDDDKDDEKDDNDSPKPKPPPTPKVRPSDAESIQRMLANLPPKRTCRQILSLNNQTIRRKIQSKAMQPQINLKKEDFDHSKLQNVKNSDSSQKSEKKNLRSSASSSSSSSSSSKETTPVKEDIPSSVSQKKGFMKQVHAKAKSVIRNLSKTFAKSPSKRLTRSSNNSSPEIINDEGTKPLETQVTETSEAITPSDEKIKDQKEGQPIMEENVQKKSVAETEVVDKNDVIQLKDYVKLDNNEDKTENENKLDVPLKNIENEPDSNKKIEEPSESLTKLNVPETVVTNTEENVKPSVPSRRSNRRKGPARKSICSVEKAYESDSNEANTPTIKNTSSKINPEIKTLLHKSTINPSLENSVPSIPSNTQLTITVSPQPGSSSLLTPISGPNTNVGESFTPLSSPALRTSTESLLKTPPGKRKPKKLTDCIAMLTGKLQYQQPNPVIEPISPPILSPVYREIPKMIVTHVPEPVQNEPEPEAMDLSAKSRPKSPNQAPITWTADGVLDLSKKPAIRHSVENMISPVSHRSSLSPSFMSPPPPQITDPFITNKQQSFNSSFSYSLPNLTPPVSDFSKNQSSSSSSKRKSNTPKISKEPEQILNYELPPMMGSPPLDLPPAAVLSMIGLGVPAITIPLPLPLSFQPPPNMNLIDFGPQQTSTPIIIPEISTPSSSNRSSSSRRSKPKPRNLRNETETHEKSRSAEVANSDTTVNNKNPGTKYSSIDTIVDSIESVIKQSAIEAESSQKFESTFIPFHDMCPMPINNFVEFSKPEQMKPVECENVSDPKEDPIVKQNIKSVEKALDNIRTLSDEKDNKTVASNESKAKRSNKATKEPIVVQSPIVTLPEPLPIITKDTDFEELIDKVRSPPTTGDSLSKTDDEIEATALEKDSKVQSSDEVQDKGNSARTRGRKAGKKKITTEKPKEKEIETPTNISIEKANVEVVEKTIEDGKNHDIEQEKIQKDNKDTNKSRNNSPAVRKTTEFKPLDDVQLAKIGYRRKSIRLLGLDPDLAEFYDEPIDRAPPKPEKNSNKKKVPTKSSDTNENKDVAVSLNTEKVVTQSETDKDNLHVHEPEVRKSPRRSQRGEKSSVASPVVSSDNQDNASDDEPLSKKVGNSLEKLKKSPTKKMPPKKRNSARKIVDSPIPEVENVPETPEVDNKVAEVSKNVSLVEEIKTAVNIEDNVKKTIRGRPRKDKIADVVVEPEVEQNVDEKETEIINNNVAMENTQNEVLKEVKKNNKRKGRPPKNNSAIDTSLDKNEINVNKTNVIATDTKVPLNNELVNPVIEPLSEVAGKNDTAESSMTKDDEKDNESDKIVDNESLKENQMKTVKARKKRKNELAAIIADQLLESFKEVDNSRKDELKILHDLSCEKNENNDELLVSAIRTTPVPRRKAATKAKDAIESESESRLTSPLRKKIETQNIVPLKDEPVSVVNTTINKTDDKKVNNSKRKNKTDKQIDELSELNQSQEKISDTKIENEPSKVTNLIEVKEVETSNDSKMKEDTPANKKTKTSNTKKKFVPPPMSITDFIDDEEISFKRTTRKQFAQEIAIMNQLKHVTKQTVEPTIHKTPLETLTKSSVIEETASSLKEDKVPEKIVVQKGKKSTKTEKEKSSVKSKTSFDDNKSDPDDDLTLSALSGKPTIRTRKLSIELEDLSTLNLKKGIDIDKNVKIGKGRANNKKSVENQKSEEKSMTSTDIPIITSISNALLKENDITSIKSSISDQKINNVEKDVVKELKKKQQEPTVDSITSVTNTHLSKASPSLDLDITESLEKLDKTKKVTERNAILSDLFDHLKEDPKKSNDADSSGFETDISKNSSNISTKTKQSKSNKKSGNGKKNTQQKEDSKTLKLNLNSINEPSVDKMAALNIFCKGLDIPMVKMTDPESTPISPTSSSGRSIFLRPSALDKVLDNKNDSEIVKVGQETESPKKATEPIRSSLRNKRSSIETSPPEKAPKRRNSVRNEKDKIKAPKMSELLSTSRDSDLYAPSFHEMSFNDDEIDESSLKINEIVNNLINRAELSESDDEKLPLAQSMRNTGKKRVSIEEIPTTILTDSKNESVSDYEDNANTDMLDMDLDDDCSVITDYTICRNESEGKIGSRIPRKRKYRKSVLCKKRKVVRKETVETAEEYNCAICKKNFKKAEGLSKHKTTLSHIAKLSEIEYIMSQKEKENAIVAKQIEVHRELTPEPQKITKDLFLERPESPIISKPNTPDILIPGYSPTNSPRRQFSRSPIRSMLTPTGIEPISSPEHIEPSYDRHNALIRKAPDNSRVQLNSEERLFYEVCSMLKGTKSNKNSNFASAPKSNEITNNLSNIQHHVGYSVKSPPTNSRSSPKAAFPKSDMNQFSDISSDSNPHVFRRQTKTTKGKTFADYVSPQQNHLDSAAMENKNAILRQEFYDSFSDMGDSFQSSHNDSDNDVSMKKQLNSTLLDKKPSKNSKYFDSDKESPISSPTLETKGVNAVYASSLHSTASSRNSNVSKIKTKAAMKGFDNFKVSIPTTGLDMDNVKKNDVIPPVNAESPQKRAKKAKETPPAKRMFKNKSQKQKGGRTTAQNNKKQTNSLIDSSSKDIYTFDDSQDSVDKPVTDSFRSGKSGKSSSKPSSEIDKVTDEQPRASEIIENDESQQSSTSFSDRDDFVYGDNNPSSASSSESSSDSFVSISTKTKEPKKPDSANLQKKSLMMAKIFNKKKDSTPKQKASDTKNTVMKPKIDRDKLFDILKAENERKQEAKRIADGKESKDDKRSLSPESKKSREIANIEAEWGMSMKQIEELIGVGSRKPKRRCATNRPKNLVETWSSDEYEEFHTTKDIIALIEDAEKKAQRKVRSSSKNNDHQVEIPVKAPDPVLVKETKEISFVKFPEQNKKKVTIMVNNVTEESDNENLSAKKIPKKKVTIAKIDKPSEKSKGRGRKKANLSNKPKNIAYDSDSDFEHHIKPSVKKTATIKQRRCTIAAPVQSDSDSDDSIKTLPAKVWNAKNKEKLKVIQKSKEAEDMKPMGRRKRVASEMLYYWSSSSDDDEFGKIAAPVNNIDEDESQDSDDHQQQHGWIVGDSHKKLVTLLAHAKAKKVDDWSSSTGGKKK